MDRKNKIKLVDGFLNEEWFLENFDVLDESSNIVMVPYHKLHGSLYWEKKNGIVKRNSNIARDIYLNQELMIVYPSDKKILTENPYFYSHQMLNSYLIRTDILLVIGFSFRDPAIVQSFEYALNFNKKLQIFIVNPEFEEEDFPEMAQFINTYKDRVIHLVEFFGTESCLTALENAIGHYTYPPNAYPH